VTEPHTPIAPVRRSHFQNEHSRRGAVVVPNDKLASDTITNASIRNRETFAEITVPVPLAADLGAVVDGLREEPAPERDARVFVSALDAGALVTVRAAVGSTDVAEQLEKDMRLRAHRRLRALGVSK